MCGILGVIGNVEKEVFKHALDTLTHRGPDDFGIETIDGQITLGHRRLSIVDINNGHQPMFDNTKRFSVIFNGEIYNFIEIKKELESIGYQFRTHSDTEVLLNAYIEWGDKCVLKFNGMWAFAIFDRYKKKCFLSRDRFGKKPLFYAKVKGTFIFASEMKAIYPFLHEVKPSKDFHWMKRNIFSYETTEKCLIDGINRFPLGFNAVYENNELKFSRYWNTLDHLVEVPDSYDEQVERFRELFLDACKIRMRSDVPIGTALSGGLDSSSTISAMAHLSKDSLDYGTGDWQHAFVASFPGTPLDESYYAKMAVDNIGIDATYVDINPLRYWENLEEYFYKFEELYITSPIPMLMLYDKVKQHGISVTLDGHGADEMFSGYGLLFVEALWDNKFSIKNTMNILNTYIATMANDPQHYQDSRTSVYLKYMIKKIIKNSLGKRIDSKDFNHPGFKKLDNFSQHLYVIFHETILPTIIRNFDRYSMINGVEIRMPFMDHRIVTYVNSLPIRSKMGNGYTKKIIRDAMAPYIPKQIAQRKKKMGFNSPIVNWMQKDLKEWFSDTVHEKSFLESNLVDNPDELRSGIMNVVNKKENSFILAEQYWTDLTPFIWEKAIIKRKDFRYS